VLDEPTNDLDIETLELLEELLEDYSGTVFLVSHDRTFLDNVVTQVIVAEGEGQWREFVGGYSDWERVRDTVAAPARPPSRPQPRPSRPRLRRLAPRPPRRKTQLQGAARVEELPKLIAALEDEQAALTLQLSDPDFYKERGRGAPRQHPHRGNRARTDDRAGTLGSDRVALIL
jgi:ATP-binding cassette subfamily F protein uup